MPRPRKPARLYLHPTERVWLIRDGEDTLRTGCGEHDRGGAEKALAAHVGAKFTVRKRESDPARLSVAEVLTAYGAERAPNVGAPATIGHAISALLPFWADKTLADVRLDACNRYGDYRRRKIWRGNPIGDGTIRRELGVLTAAINYWHEAHGPLTSVPVVSMPGVPGSRTRWLTRSEAALLLAGALGFYREAWCDVASRKERVRWRRNRKAISRHLARFILLGLATGSRRGALLDVQWIANTTGGWIDVDRGVMHRRAEGAGESKKRRPPVRLGKKILAHLRRWKRMDMEARAAIRAQVTIPLDAPAFLHVVNYRGAQLLRGHSAWDNAREFSYLDDAVTAHVLRHTRATWLMQRGIDPWQASGSLGMSRKTLEDVYGHHHPDWQKEAAEV